MCLKFAVIDIGTYGERFTWRYLGGNYMFLVHVPVVIHLASPSIRLHMP